MRKFFTKKRIIISAILLVIILFIGYKIMAGKNNTNNILTDTVKRQDIKQTVLATGQVTSNVDLNLSFKSSGIVNSIRVKVGDKVRAGQILAQLDEKDAVAAINQAQAQVQSAQANYDKLVNGASNPDVEILRVALNNAKNTYANTVFQQQVLVDNAKSTMLNAGLEAMPSGGNSSTGTVTVTGTYTGEQGQYLISVYMAGDGLHLTANGLESANEYINKGIAAPLGKKGLYLTFSSTGTFGLNDSWTLAIPNTQSSTYLTYYNAYQSALQTQAQAMSTAKGSMDAAQAALDQKLSTPRQEDLNAVSAQVASAQAQLQTARNAYMNNEIIAPIAGTITSIDAKVGELASGLKEVIVLQDVDKLHVESNISEANIATIKSGLPVDVTYDAFGPDRASKAVVDFVDPASTVISGVVNYKVTSTLDNPSADIKPGMTANLTILTAEKSNVLTVPQRALVLKNGKKYIRVITNEKSKTYREQEITTGLEADGGLVEVLSGVQENEVIVSFIKA